MKRILAASVLVLTCGQHMSSAQTSAQGPGPDSIRICDGRYPVRPPTDGMGNLLLPPGNSDPVVYVLALCFAGQGHKSVVELTTYLSQIRTPRSMPSQNKWVPHDSLIEKTIGEDIKRLTETNFLESATVETVDYKFANGVIGKVIVYHLQERPQLGLVQR
jgi:hypothetical protein